MKKWLKSHYKAILSVLFCIVYYLLLFRICVDYIDFGHDTDDNIKVAKFYFIVLPIATVLPIALYRIIAYIRKR